MPRTAWALLSEAIASLVQVAPVGADEQAIAQRIAPIRANAGIVLERGPEVVDPVGGVRVAIAALQPAVVIELEMIVGIHQAGQDERPVEIDHRIAAGRSRVDLEDSRRETNRGCGPLTGAVEQIQALPQQELHHLLAARPRRLRDNYQGTAQKQMKNMFDRRIEDPGRAQAHPLRRRGRAGLAPRSKKL